MLLIATASVCNLEKSSIHLVPQCVQCEDKTFSRAVNRVSLMTVKPGVAIKHQISALVITAGSIP